MNIFSFLEHLSNVLEVYAFGVQKENGHKEDILCVAKSEVNLLATASYDGEIIVWNMVSGHIFCRLNSPRPHDYKDENC